MVTVSLRPYHKGLVRLGTEATFAREHAALVQARSETGIKDCTIVTWEDERELDDGIQVVPVWKWVLKYGQ